MMAISPATALLNKKPGTKVVLHYDTTSRSRIDGEWPSLRLNFSGNDASENQMIPLRPLSFAYENK